MLTQKFALKIFEGFSIQRWTDLIRPFDIVEMDKAGEKMVLAYIIGKCEEQKGVFVDWTWMIYASLFDILKKIALCDIKAPIQQILKKDYASEYLRLNEWILNQYKPLIDDSALFSQFTIYEGQRAGTFDIPEKSRAAERILSAANKFATMRELQMLSIVNEPERLEKINKELLADLQGYLDLTGLQLLMTRQKSYDFIMKIEQLRFQTRWNQTPRVPKTSVLGHCFFVAVITLLLCRQSGQKMCEKRLINNYFSALFHDLPEAVTRDIISPVKQATDELPSIVKRIEDEIVNKELVPLMEPYFSDELMYFTSDEFSNRAIFDNCVLSISFNELNSKFNEDRYSPVDGKLVRAADHLSALLEAHLSIQHGITSVQLQKGRENLYKGYKKGVLVNGIDVPGIFDDIMMTE